LHTVLFLNSTLANISSCYDGSSKANSSNS
jgi:hypothetical protein